MDTSRDASRAGRVVRVAVATLGIAWAWTSLHPSVAVVGGIVVGAVAWLTRTWAPRSPEGRSSADRPHGRTGRHGRRPRPPLFEAWAAAYVDSRVLPPHAWMSRPGPAPRIADADPPPGDAAELLSLAPPGATVRGTARDDGTTITLETATGPCALSWAHVDHHAVLASPAPTDSGVAIVFVATPGGRRCLIVDDPHGRWRDELRRRRVPGPPPDRTGHHAHR